MTLCVLVPAMKQGNYTVTVTTAAGRSNGLRLHVKKG